MIEHTELAIVAGIGIMLILALIATRYIYRNQSKGQAHADIMRTTAVRALLTAILLVGAVVLIIAFTS